MQLNDGVYTIRFVNESSQPVTIDWLLKIANLDWEKIVDNGVGQTSALSLGLFSSPSGDSGSSSAASVRVSALSHQGPGAPSRDRADRSRRALLVTLNTGLIGQPTLGSQSVAVVGPSVRDGIDRPGGQWQQSAFAIPVRLDD